MTVHRITIGPRRRPCVDVAPRECLEVRWHPGGPWELFYDDIEGFTYEPGYEWDLDVDVIERDAAPADASTRQYRLVDVAQRRRVAGA